ncbi:hypothetical protein VN0232_06250 [Helicobacter pylori]|nr:hypothetical protein VN0232_06250 [Helicobacter pylori]
MKIYTELLEMILKNLILLFVVKIIEANFYTISGSKLNEVSRSYQELALKFEAFPNYEFIWITDGIGWLDAKSKLQEVYKSVEIYNLSNVNGFISKVQKW